MGVRGSGVGERGIDERVGLGITSTYRQSTKPVICLRCGVL